MADNENRILTYFFKLQTKKQRQYKVNYSSKAPSIHMSLAPPILSNNNVFEYLCKGYSQSILLQLSLRPLLRVATRSYSPSSQAYLYAEISWLWMKFHCSKYSHSTWTNWHIKGYALIGCELIVKVLISARLFPVWDFGVF